MISPKPLQPKLRVNAPSASSLLKLNPNQPAARPLRRPMTIAIGFAYDDGLVLCADTKIGSNSKTNESKIEHFVSSNGYCRIAFAMTGVDLSFPRAAIRNCWQSIQQIDFATTHIEKVRDAIDSHLAGFYKGHIYEHPDRTPGQVFFQFLIGVWLRDQSHLYLSHETVTNSVDEYECIGGGAYLAKYLIEQYRRANPGANGVRDAALIARHAVQEAIDYDEGCGGTPQLLIIQNDGTASNQLEGLGYPSNMFLDVFSDLKWKLIRDLAYMSAEDRFGNAATERVDGFSKQVHELDSAKWNF